MSVSRIVSELEELEALGLAGLIADGPRGAVAASNGIARRALSLTPGDCLCRVAMRWLGPLEGLRLSETCNEANETGFASLDTKDTSGSPWRVAVRRLTEGLLVSAREVVDPTPRAQFERILDSTPDGIMVLDPDRRVRFFNRACGELLGRDPRIVIESNCVCGSVTGCHSRDGQSLSATQLCPAKDLFSGNGDISHAEEMLCTGADGSERWIETKYSAVRGADGNLEFVVGVIRDVEERKRLEEKLRQSEKLAALGELTAGIAHEIKNPLGVLLSSVELILDPTRSEEMRREAASFIREEVQRLDARLRAFLAFARPDPVHADHVQLGALTANAVASLEAATHGIAVDMRLASEDLEIEADEDQMRRVLVNLLLNAVEALEDRPDPKRIAVELRREGPELLLTIDDSGPGIAEDVRDRIFDPFFTTKARGTGLGLSIVSRIVLAHGGRIAAGTSPLGGARITVHLPAAHRL